MATVQYTAKVKESRLLELPEESQELELQPGQEVQVIFNSSKNDTTLDPPPNDEMLAALAEIAQLNKGLPFSDGSNTQCLLSEARAGAMYGYEPAE